MHSSGQMHAHTPSFLQGTGFKNFHKTTNLRFGEYMYLNGFFFGKLEYRHATNLASWTLGTVTNIQNQHADVRQEFGRNSSLYSGYSGLNNSQFKRELPYQRMTVGGVGVRRGRSMFASAGIERWQKRKDYLSRIS